MLASLDEASLVDPRLAYEPKYDGIRTLASVRAGGGPGGVRLTSRLGNDKTAQFPEIVRALGVFARKLKADGLRDGEIVALDQRGEPTGFQRLQGRIHLASEREIVGREGTEPVAFVAFDGPARRRPRRPGAAADGPACAPRAHLRQHRHHGPAPVRLPPRRRPRALS